MSERRIVDITDTAANLPSNLELKTRIIKSGFLPEDKIYRGDLEPVTGSYEWLPTLATIVVQKR